MDKKHFLGIIVVLIISGFVLFTDLKQTPVRTIWQAAQKINLAALLLVFLLIIFSYCCEAGILATLAQRRNEAHHSIWAFFRIPLIQALFNAITPMSTGGQPAQLLAMVQMGIEGGRATSLLLMKFILYQIVVLFAYLLTIIFGFGLVAGKFAALAVFIAIGFMIHISSIIFLFAIMFAYNWTKKFCNWLLDQLAKIMAADKIERWRQAINEKIDTFYRESQKLKQEKKKLLLATSLTILQLLAFYSVPYFILLALGVSSSWLQVTQMNIMIIMFMAIIPIPGASGGAEFSFQTLFSSFISTSSTLVLAMFIWRFATYFFGMLLGILGWSFKPKKIEL